jgi:hypothetical protein
MRNIGIGDKRLPFIAGPVMKLSRDPSNHRVTATRQSKRAVSGQKGWMDVDTTI